MLHSLTKKRSITKCLLPLFLRHCQNNRRYLNPQKKQNPFTQGKRVLMTDKSILVLTRQQAQHLL